jgi:uncharacterized NAD(P)/FAD-binding protein YdhS
MTITSQFRPSIAVIGAGASGTLTAIHLMRAAGRRATALELVLIDPADRWGRGVAFGTSDDRHLLNVPASGLSALPEDPGHFVSWLSRQHPDGDVGQSVFAPRREYARYLDETLTEAVGTTFGLVSLRHLRTRATGLRRTVNGLTVQTADGREVPAEAVVLATGLAATGHDWAPEPLRHSAFFVDDPWAPGALDVVRRDRSGPADVLIVGTGLTMVDVALSLGVSRDAGVREDRRLYAVSRHARLPAAHTEEQSLAVIPDISEWGHTLAELRENVERHVSGVVETTGDWRPAVDGVRIQAPALWARLSEEDRATFVARDAGEWNVARHRVPPASSAAVRELMSAGRLQVEQAEVVDADPLPLGGLAVRLSDGTRREVGWVVNCTGPAEDVRTLTDPLLDDLLRPRGGVASLASGGMGFRTKDGRLVDDAGTAEAPVWTLGALRRGELWETTAIPEIRTQARALAIAVLDSVAPLSRRLADGRLVSGHHPVARPRDPLGLPISTTAEAAAAYGAGLERVMRQQSGAEELIRESVQLDPGFAAGHAALALLGHEAGAEIDVPTSLRDAREAVRTRGDAREASLVDVVTQRVNDVRGAGAQALMAHIAQHPRDVLAVSAAVPTIAFSGVTDVQQEVWDLVEGLAPAYGDHWWYISLLAFTRQDQGRFDEAGLLAENALSCEPSSGHAVHALAHVMYETGQHQTGLVWLDHWVAESGRTASHRAHFSWHAALHELTLGDTEAVRRRYYSQLAPPQVAGVRALVDSASLLWRWRVTTAEWDHASAEGLSAPPAFSGEGAAPPVEAVLESVSNQFLDAPETPFVALHSAFALAGAGESARLRALRDHCLSSGNGMVRSVVATVCEALGAFLEHRWSAAADLLIEVGPSVGRLGGSAAQREIVEETLLFCLVNDGRLAEAVALLDARLERRPSPLDRRRSAAVTRGPRSEIAF